MGKYLGDRWWDIRLSETVEIETNDGLEASFGV